MEMLNHILFGVIEIQYIWRIILAGLCGLVIGYERKSRAKEAGIRTHFVVCSGAALLMIISKYGFNDMASGHDGARIAAQIVSGVGFLGAGIIFVQKRTVTGLTTAAGIWATSGIGMAIGGGMFSIGLAATIIIVTAQNFLHKNISFLKTPKLRIMRIKTDNTNGFQQYVTTLLGTKHIVVHDVGITKSEADDHVVYEFEIEFPPQLTEEEIINMFNCDCSIKPFR